MAVSFLCSLAPLQSAIQITGDGNGMRIKLDIPQSEMAEAVHLLTMTGQVLRVTVEPEIQVVTGGETRDMATRRQRKPRWTTTEAPHNDADAGAGGRAYGRDAGRSEDVRQAVVGAGSLGATDHPEVDAA